MISSKARITLFCLMTSFATNACTSTSSDAIENEQNPLQDSDCLDGEYFDKNSQSCEPIADHSESLDENSSDDYSSDDLTEDIEINENYEDSPEELPNFDE